MQEQEGVIKYHLSFTTAEPCTFSRFAALDYWRSRLHQLGLIGQDPTRYGGYGFGNISSRLQPGQRPFLISATQTGHLPRLSRAHYALVTDFDLQHNWLQAEGSHPPSSEALTHASIYAACPDAGCVMHVHWPKAWAMAATLAWPVTAAEIPYGTPAMAVAVQDLVRAQGTPAGVIAMGGHEDGVLVYGRDEEAAGALLLDLWRQVEDGVQPSR